MHVVITGASSGIGEALALEYARRGATLTLVARRGALLEGLAARCGVACHVVAHDLSDPARAVDWLADAEAALGPIDILINNAGAENTGPTASSDPEEGERVLRLNLASPLRLARAVLPAMIQRGGGSIVNVASVAALAAPPGQAWYGASKAGLAMFSETLRGEVRRTGVHVLTVYPGPVKTPMGDAGYEAYGGRGGRAGLLPEGRPDVLARRIAAAVEGRRARLIYPRSLGLAYWLPWLARWVNELLAPLPRDRQRGNGPPASGPG